MALVTLGFIVVIFAVLYFLVIRTDSKYKIKNRWKIARKFISYETSFMPNWGILLKLCSIIQHHPTFNLIIHHTKYFLLHKNWLLLIDSATNISHKVINNVLKQSFMCFAWVTLYEAPGIDSEMREKLIKWNLLRSVHTDLVSYL